MDQASIDLLAGRVDRLERENRRLKRIGAAVVLGLLGVMIAGAHNAAARDIVEARQFRLVDEQGRGRITTFVSPDGKTVIGFFDQDARALDAWIAGAGYQPEAPAKVRRWGPSLALRAGIMCLPSKRRAL